jgi:hypothetical protein
LVSILAKYKVKYGKFTACGIIKFMADFLDCLTRHTDAQPMPEQHHSEQKMVLVHVTYCCSVADSRSPCSLFIEIKKEKKDDHQLAHFKYRKKFLSFSA